MNYEFLTTLNAILNNIEIPSIGSEINFWMIRSKAGHFYDEFVNDMFIALGWNYIDKSTSFSDDNVELLKQGIIDRYGEKRPILAVNKCKRFIHEIKNGDYVLIPNAGSSEIAIGIIGDYFEEENLDYTKEIISIKKIDNKECEINSVKCPYKKRRKVKILLKVSSKRIGHKLLRAISSYHGLSDMNEYAEDILNCVYNCYEYKEDLIYAVNVAKKERIKPRELSTLFYGVTELFCNIIDEDLLSVTVNINSPGKFVVRLENGYKKIKKCAIPLVAVYLFAFGGSGFGFEFPGLVDGVIGVMKEIRLMDIEVAREQEELKSTKLENYKKTLELIDACKSEDIDIDKVINDLKIIEGLNGALCFESNEKFAFEEKEEIMDTNDITEE